MYRSTYSAPTVNGSEADALQHGQERRRFHVGDPDLVLILGQFAVKHGMEHRTANSQDVLNEARNNADTMRDDSSV